jgi:hypothetical protein
MREWATEEETCPLEGFTKGDTSWFNVLLLL